jgi:DSF synthase
MDMHVHPALFQASHPSALHRAAADFQVFFSSQLSATYDSALRALWCTWTPAPRPSFNRGLLEDLRAYCRYVGDARTDPAGEDADVEYTVLCSGVPGVFNLGGDLDLFVQLIEARDRAALLAYGTACIDVLYRNYVGHGRPITTVSLVQGECLGGGFEAALSSDIIVAERHARFGFPEILFNLFPGMGAYSFLDRRIGRRATEELLSTGKIYGADDMLRMGVVDHVVGPGEGRAMVQALVRRQARTRNGLQAIAAARRRVHRITYEELTDVVSLWVDAALRLTARDMKLMQRLVSRQNDIRQTSTAH